MFVKICGITSLDDALTAVELGAGAIGFNFYPRSPRYIAPERAAEISARLPSRVWRVGVFVNAPPDSILETAAIAGLHVAQLHGRESPEEIPAGIRAWKAFRVGEDFSRETAARYAVEAVLLDSPAGAWFGGTGATFDWRQAVDLPHRLVLAGGLDASNVAEAIRLLRPWGIDACSRLESAPGRKDPQKLRQFLEAALPLTGEV